ncbi:hypothetical protein J3F83DRAFT_230807 [Trichoderma novae-zelandiae]
MSLRCLMHSTVRIRLRVSVLSAVVVLLVCVYPLQSSSCCSARCSHLHPYKLTAPAAGAACKHPPPPPPCPFESCSSAPLSASSGRGALYCFQIAKLAQSGNNPNLAQDAARSELLVLVLGRQRSEQQVVVPELSGRTPLWSSKSESVVRLLAMQFHAHEAGLSFALCLLFIRVCLLNLAAADSLST